MNKKIYRKLQKYMCTDHIYRKDFNCSITWAISNTRLKKFPILICSEYLNYTYVNVNEKEINIGFIEDFDVIYDKVAKAFNILESEKPYFTKYMYDFSYKDLYTLDKNSDFAKFLAKYNFELQIVSDED